MKTKTRAFTLFGLLIVLGVLVVLTGLIAPYGAAWYEARLISQEKTSVDYIAEAVKAGFVSSDSRRNISYFSGASFVPTHGQTLTTFTASFNSVTNPSFVLTDDLWFSKVGRTMGFSFVSGATVTPDQGDVSTSVVFNPVRRERWLLLGPTNETDYQRYLVISLMVNADAPLVMPTNDGSAAFFNEIWDNIWNNPAATPPAGWGSRLSPTDLAAWSTSDRGRTYASRLIVRKVTQKKFTIRVSNTHSVDYGWVDIAGMPDQIVAAPNTGLSQATGVLQGRQVTFRRGDTAPGTTIIQYEAVDNVTHTLQPGS